MIKVDQEEVGKNTGDCMRAAIASVLECDLQVVPHLTRIDNKKIDWFSVMYYFMVAHKYLYKGCYWAVESKRKLLKRHSFDGFYLATVNSKTYPPGENITHMVVMDRNFIVVHDPHPNKLWQHESLLENPDFKSVYKFEKMNKTDMNYWHYLG